LSPINFPDPFINYFKCRFTFNSTVNSYHTLLIHIIRASNYDHIIHHFDFLACSIHYFYLSYPI
jgi:hypothetical protein